MHDGINQIKMVFVGLYCCVSLGIKIIQKQYGKQNRVIRSDVECSNKSDDCEDINQRIQNWRIEVDQFRREDEQRLWIKKQDKQLTQSNMNFVDDQFRWLRREEDDFFGSDTSEKSVSMAEKRSKTTIFKSSESDSGSSFKSCLSIDVVDAPKGF